MHNPMCVSQSSNGGPARGTTSSSSSPTVDLTPAAIAELVEKHAVLAEQRRRNEQQQQNALLAQAVLAGNGFAAHHAMAAAAGGATMMGGLYHGLPSSLAGHRRQQLHLSHHASHHHRSTKEKHTPENPGLTAKNHRRHFVKHNYHDHADEVAPPADEESAAAEAAAAAAAAAEDADGHNKRGGVSIPFPEKLHQMLDLIESDGHADIISWQPHGRSFCVHKPKQFVSEIMPKYFRQSKISSFQRQLNLYGFCRLTRGKDKGAYYHELFLRGKLFLCKRMVRTRVKGTGIKASSSPDQEPNFYSMRPVGGAGLGKKVTLKRSGSASPKAVKAEPLEIPLPQKLEEEEEPQEQQQQQQQQQAIEMMEDAPMPPLPAVPESYEASSTVMEQQQQFELEPSRYSDIAPQFRDMVDPYPAPLLQSTSQYHDQQSSRICEDVEPQQQQRQQKQQSRQQAPHARSVSFVGSFPHDTPNNNKPSCSSSISSSDHLAFIRQPSTLSEISLAEAELKDEAAMDAFFEAFDMEEQPWLAPSSSTTGGGGGMFDLDRDDDACLGDMLDLVVDSF